MKRSMDWSGMEGLWERKVFGKLLHHLRNENFDQDKSYL